MMLILNNGRTYKSTQIDHYYQLRTSAFNMEIMPKQLNFQHYQNHNSQSTTNALRTISIGSNNAQVDNDMRPVNNSRPLSGLRPDGWAVATSEPAAGQPLKYWECKVERIRLGIRR